MASRLHWRCTGMKGRQWLIMFVLGIYKVLRRYYRYYRDIIVATYLIQYRIERARQNVIAYYIITYSMLYLCRELDKIGY